MKSSIIHLLIYIAGLLALSGCYTSFKIVTPEESERINGMGEASPIDDGWFEASGPYFYVDYSTKEWYEYHGIDLAGDITSSKMANYHHKNPTRSYWFSFNRDSFFYNYPGYTNSYLYSSFGPFVLGSANIIPGVFHPPYYSNQYVYSFFYDRWAQWYYWDSEGPNSWLKNPFQLSALHNSSHPLADMRSTAFNSVNPDFNNSERER